MLLTLGGTFQIGAGLNWWGCSASPFLGLSQNDIEKLIFKEQCLRDFPQIRTPY